MKIIERLLGVAMLLGATLPLHAQWQDEPCDAQVYTYEEFQQLPWVGDNEILYKYLDSLGHGQQQYNLGKPLYRVPVYFWMYEDKKNKALYEKRIKWFMGHLNHYYMLNNVGIVFYLQGYTHVQENEKARMGYFMEGPMQSVSRKNPGAINVYVSNSIEKNRFGSTDYVKGTYNSITHTVFVVMNSAKATLAHEIGHYFGLLHPHENWDKGKCKAEAVSRTREFSGCMKSGLICEQSGDGLCDTPAEPNLHKYTTNDCKYFAHHMKDPWGDAYQPDVDNIMSYTKNRGCRDHFTQGQISVMLQAAAAEKDAEVWAVGPRTHFFEFDAAEPNDTRTMAHKIDIGAPYHNTFHRIYMGEGNNASSDKTDWYLFKLKQSGNITLKLKHDGGKQSAVAVSLYSTKKKEESFSWDGEKAFSRKINLSKGAYWLELESQSPFFRKYGLEITKK